MPAQEAITSVADLLESQDYSLTVVLAGANDIRRLQLSTAVAGSIKEALAGNAESLKESLPVPYSPGYKPDTHQLASLEIPTNQSVSSTLISLQSIDSLPLYQGDDDFISSLSFYALDISNGTDRLILFKRTNAKLELSRRFPHAAIFSGGQFDKVTQKTLLLDADFDCIAKDEDLLIRRVPAFESIFGYFDELKANANATLDLVLGHIKIKNYDEFRKACTGQIQMLAKLANIASKPYLATLTMDSVKKTASDFGVQLSFETNSSGEEELVFDPSPSGRWLVLKILDDDYLRSPMTTLKYETNSKLQV